MTVSGRGATRTLDEQIDAAVMLAQPLQPLQLPLSAAHGCVLAADVTASRSVPSFPTATVSGYAIDAGTAVAVQSGHTASLEVVDSLRPGFESDFPVTARQTVYLTSGSMVPASCTAVVDRPEKVPRRLSGHSCVVDITDRIEPGSGIALPGSHLFRDEVVVPAGTTLTDRAVAAVVAAGRARVSVFPQPRVLIVTVGDELVQIDEELSVGLVHDAVMPMLLSAVTAAGGHSVRSVPVRRDSKSLATALVDEVARADLIVVLSTVSAGREIDELVPEALAQLGGDRVEYCRVEPGEWIGVTQICPGGVNDDRVPLVVLNRQELAAYVGFELVVRPMIAAMAGRKQIYRRLESATLTQSLEESDGTPRLLPAQTTVDPTSGELLVQPMRESVDSASLWLYRADSIMIIPADVASLAPGDSVALIDLAES